MKTPFLNINEIVFKMFMQKRFMRDEGKGRVEIGSELLG